MDYKLDIVILLTIGFALASLLGAVAQRCKLPSILGFLVAGYLIGPYSPGFVADPHTAEQLAEIGVILMLFGVGLHFKLQDLINVKRVAIPGALGQTLVATLAGVCFISAVGWPLQSGIIMGLAISVASTVVLVRVLADNHLLETSEGHIAVGWLVVEDILTVMVLVLLPVLALLFSGEEVSGIAITGQVLLFLAKFFALAVVLLLWGFKVVGMILASVARLRSQELFTLSVLALTFVIATGSAVVFGTSIALGAFLAGMVIGQTDVRHQALANSLPLKDVFAVIFFLSIGMLFDPVTIQNHFVLFLGLLAIILLVKPVVAYLIVILLKYPAKAAITVALALSQIGEFSFILSEQATQWKLLPDEGYDLLVACAFVSISINPLLFHFLMWLEKKGVKIRKIQGPDKIGELFEQKLHTAPEVVVVGFGPIGKSVTEALEALDIVPVVVEHNIDTLVSAKQESRRIIYGDASVPNILQVTHISKAALLVITVPELATTVSIIKSALHLNPQLKIIARTTYISEKKKIAELGIEAICAEEELEEAFVEKVINVAIPKIK